MSNRFRVAAWALVPALLTACGGGGGGVEGAPSQSPAAPADTRVTLTQYSPRGAPQPLPARAEQAADYRFATEALARGVGTGDASKVVVPSLGLAQRALLIEAAEGAALATLLAPTGDPRGLAAPVRERVLSAPAAERFLPGWLLASERGNAHAAAPLTWRTEVAAAPAPGALPEGFSLTLTVRDRMSASWAWPGAVQAFDGVMAFDGGGRALTRMLRIRGEVWQLDTPLLRAQGLRLADGTQLVKLRPAQGSARDLAADSNRLGEALLQLNQGLRGGVSAAPGSVVVGNLSPDFDPLVNEQGQIGGPQDLAFAKLNGTGQYVVWQRSAALRWNADSLDLSGASSLDFIGISSSNTSIGGGFVNDNRPWQTPPPPVNCPAGTDLQPEILLGLDAQGRLVWLAYAASQGTAVAPCL